MAGYVRQSAASIVTGADILAAPLSAEFNQLQAAFNGGTGHGHTGGAGDGPKVSLTAAVSGILPVANGGTAGATAAQARTALGLEIGTNVQAFDAGLLSIAGLTTLADRMIYTTASDVYAVTTLTSFARTLLDDADAATMRTTLGVDVAGANQPLDADLTALAGNSTDGFWAHISAGNGAARTLTAPAAGLTISNPAGIAGNPTFALANDLAALEAMSGTGLVIRTDSETYTQRTVTGTANEITVTNGDGASGNPTLSLPSALTFTGKTIANGNFTSPTVNGTITASGIVTMSGTFTGGTYTASAFNGTLGATTPAAGTFTTLNATGGGALTGTWTNLGTVTTIDINGGTLDGVIIGGASSAAATVTTLAAGATTVTTLTGTGALSGFTTGAFSSTLTVTGNITGNSDKRLKKNIKTIAGALDKILKIRGVYFNRKSDDDRNIGVIAQELQEVVPEMVKKHGEYLSVDYGSGFALLVEAIKELVDEVRAM